MRYTNPRTHSLTHNHGRQHPADTENTNISVTRTLRILTLVASFVLVSDIIGFQHNSRFFLLLRGQHTPRMVVWGLDSTSKKFGSHRLR